MKVLVAGATGFIGGNVVRAALAAGHHVRAMHREGSRMAGLADLLAPPTEGLETVVADIRVPETLGPAMADCDAIVHCAGYYPTVSFRGAEEVDKARRQMTAMLRAAREAGVKRLVYTSSLSTVGPAASGSLADEDIPYVPGSVWDPYYQAKWVTEQQCLAANGAALETVALLPTVCVGPGDANRTIFKPIQMVATLPVVPYFRGKVNIVDVRAVADAHVSALTQGKPGQRYVVVGENTTFRTYFQTIARALGRRRTFVPVPSSVGWAASWVSEIAASFITRRPPLLPIENINMVRHGQHFDGSRGRRAFGVRATDLDDAVGAAVGWYRAARYL